MSLNQQQKRYVLDQLSHHSNWQRKAQAPKLKKPAVVIKAEAMKRKALATIERFDRRQRKVETEFDKARATAISEVRRVALFGEPEEALKLLDKLNKRYPLRKP